MPEIENLPYLPAIATTRIVAYDENGSILGYVPFSHFGLEPFDPFMIGEVKIWPSETIPDKWLVCDFSQIPRTSLLGIWLDGVWGVGDGVSTYNLPNFRGQALIGPSDDYTFRTFGGKPDHSIQISQLPAHSHDIKGSVAYDGIGTFLGDLRLSSSVGFFSSDACKSAGGGEPHNNMQPYTVINFIIYAGEIIV